MHDNERLLIPIKTLKPFRPNEGKKRKRKAMEEAIP
jgi:hypothetical protein